MNFGWKTVAVLSGVLVGSIIMSNNDDSKPKRVVVEQTAEQKAQAAHESLMFDLSLASAADLQNHMRDPLSYFPERIFYKGDWVCIKYHSRNGFGGMNSGYAASNIKKGRLYIDNAGTWNAHCVGKSGFTEVATHL